MIIVRAGTPIFKIEIKLVKLVNSFTDQKFNSVNTRMNMNTTIKPEVVIVPSFKKECVQFAQAQGQELMY